MLGEQKKLGSLLKDFKFQIPDYQRAYEWKVDNFDDFIEDLNYYKKHKSYGFIGSIILSFQKNKKDVAEIVDGQQRITSILLYLIALVNRFKQKSDLSKIYRKLNEYESLYYHSDDHPRLKAHSSINNVFKTISNPDWDPKNIEHRNILKEKNSVTRAYISFEKEAEKFRSTDQIKNMIETICNLDVIQLKVESSEEAFHIFETTNARGKELEVGDLLRNHIFSKSNNQEREQVKERWDEIVNLASGQTVAMLRQFYFTKKGYVSKKFLYKEIKKLDLSALNLLNEIESYANFFSVMKDGDESDFNNYVLEITKGNWDANEGLKKLFISVAALRDFNHIQPYPLFFSFLQKFKELQASQKVDRKNISNLFANIESFQFINYNIGNNRAGKVEHMYADFSKKISLCDTLDNLQKVLSSFYDEIEGLLDSEEVFESKFTSLSLINNTAKVRRSFRYIFSKYDSFLLAKNSEGLSDIYKPGAWLTNTDNIEHWAPQNFNNVDSKYYEIWNSLEKETIQNIGNLLIINSRFNSKLGNKEPQIKFEKSKNLSDKTTAIFSKFLAEYHDHFESWDTEAIKNRAKALSKISYKKLWKIINKVH